MPLDEALVQCAVDVSGRPYCVHVGEPEGQEFVSIGDAYLGSLTRHVFETLAHHAQIALHVRVLCGRDPHHIVESQFKAVARALRDAVALDPRETGVPSTKGLTLSTHCPASPSSTTAPATSARPSARSSGPAPRSRSRRRVTTRWTPTGSSSPASGRSPRAWRAAAVHGHEIIGRRLAGGRPVLGICVGMQILFERGVEHGVETEGCDEWPGVVERLQAPVVPHMGWNTVDVPDGSSLFAGIEDERFYFVHSYGVRDWTLVTNGRTRAPLVTWAEHGGDRFVAAVENGPLVATQFHPEKSGDAGARLLRNWVAGALSEQGAGPPPRGARARGGHRAGRAGTRRPRSASAVRRAPGRSPGWFPSGTRARPGVLAERRRRQTGDHVAVLIALNVLVWVLFPAGRPARWCCA